MTEIEKRARELINKVQAEYPLLGAEVSANLALCRAIEQHETFRQEVSDVCEGILAKTEAHKRYGASLALNRFIITKPVDPLVAAIGECDDGTWDTKAEYADKLRAALAKRGLEIREVE